jgi:hypothetical protein
LNLPTSESAQDEKQSYAGDLLRQAVEYVKTGNGLKDQTVEVVGLDLPSRGDANNRVMQVEHIVRLLKKYHADKMVQRPLSIVVFGPPGSGKSTFVRSITSAVAGCELVTTANLTQLSTTDELAAIFEAVTEPSQDNSAPPPVESLNTPVFFFDEFDAALNGAPLGWLSWFLAPMQDGVVSVRGTNLSVQKAVFMFAGGTAESLDEFNLRGQLSPETYRARKVPDFVSRLRGAIDIGGINGRGDARIVSRALVLRRIFEKRPNMINDQQIGLLLTNGHFVHGVRSMLTLLEAGWSEQNAIDLPEAILRQHFSRGEMDGQVVGISAGLKETGSGPMFSALTTQLIRSGATLAYAGAFTPEGTLEQMLEAELKAPSELGGTTAGKPRLRNYLGYPATLRTSNLNSPDDRHSMDFVALKTINTCELEDLGVPVSEWFKATVDVGDTYDPRRHVAWALSLFRLRVRMMQDVSALVVLGGKDDGRSWGRFAGVAEEVMIALALGKPIFVLGGAGGAAHAVGQLLGLDEVLVGIEQCLTPAVHNSLEHALVPYSSNFDIPGEPKSPRNLADLRRFLFHRGVTTSAWPWNGLTEAENRQLFAISISSPGEPVANAVELILQGLSRIEWKPTGP